MHTKHKRIRVKKKSKIRSVLGSEHTCDKDQSIQTITCKSTAITQQRYVTPVHQLFMQFDIMEEHRKCLEALKDIHLTAQLTRRDVRSPIPHFQNQSSSSYIPYLKVHA